MKISFRINRYAIHLIVEACHIIVVVKQASDSASAFKQYVLPISEINLRKNIAIGIVINISAAVHHLVVEACHIIVVVKQAGCWPVPNDWGTNRLQQQNVKNHTNFENYIDN